MAGRIVKNGNRNGNGNGAGSGNGDGGDGKDKLPGEPWKPTTKPTPDSGSPQGDGKHRK